MKLSHVHVFTPFVFTFSIGTLQIEAFCEPCLPLPVLKANYQLSLDEFEIYEDKIKVLEKLNSIYPNEDLEKRIDDTMNHLFVKLYKQVESLSKNLK